MPEMTLPPASQPIRAPWSADVVFDALADGTRRRLLQALADGQPRTATILAQMAGNKLDPTLKHLITLRKSGIVAIAAKEGRRQLYAISPQLPVTRTATGWDLDFGCCLVRG